MIIDMTLNGSGIRDIARVLGISTVTVMSELKKKRFSSDRINHNLLEFFKNTENIEVEVFKVEEAEADEMWSFVRKKSNQRWLWHAIDHKTGEIPAYVFGDRKDEVFRKLRELIIPFGIVKFHTDDWDAYERNLDASNHEIGKKNTQKTERKHLTLRTRIKRLARRTIRFSKSEKMHDILLGLFINKYEFGLVI